MVVKFDNTSEAKMSHLQDFPIALSFDDVLITPKKGVLEHRKDADISTYIAKGLKLEIPIISAPMESVTKQNMAWAMWNAGGFGFIHRNMSVDDQVNLMGDFYFRSFPQEPIRCMGVAIGVNEDYTRFKRLYEAGTRVFCVEVAHAHHDSVGRFIDNLPAREDDIVLVAGNVATHEGALFLANLGVNAVKVGIGPGAACRTREVTGIGVPQLSAIMSVYQALRFTEVTIIADGGIKNSGDILKALAAGADTVMLGRLLAGADESPHPGLYWGMASKRVNGHRAPEGVEGAVPKTGPVEDTLKELAWGIRSGVSYIGSNLKELRENAEFNRVTPQSLIESGHRL